MSHTEVCVELTDHKAPLPIRAMVLRVWAWDATVAFSGRLEHSLWTTPGPEDQTLGVEP